MKPPSKLGTYATIERITIAFAMLQIRPRSNSELAEQFEVCSKTVQRDLQFMRDRLGMPLEYDSQKGKWEIEKTANLSWWLAPTGLIEKLTLLAKQWEMDIIRDRPQSLGGMRFVRELRAVLKTKQL